MLSTLIDAVGYALFTLAAYWAGGKAAAAAVGGVCVLVVSYQIAAGGESVRKKITQAVRRDTHPVLPPRVAGPPTTQAVTTRETMNRESPVVHPPNT